MKTDREAYEAGTILFHLDSNRGETIPFAFDQLRRDLSLLNVPLTPYDLRDRLEYLVGKGYIEAVRVGQVGKRPGGNQHESFILTVKLTPKGIDLVKRRIDDAGVIVP